MRKLLLGTVLVILSVQFLYAQNNETLTAPIGTVKIKENLYVDQIEILNFHWLEFMHYIKRDSTLAYDLAPKDNLNFEDPFYILYPIYNITYSQALMYCKWRSEVVSKKWSKKIVYRLPTPSEWNQIAAKILREFSSKKKNKLNKTGRLRISHGNSFLKKKISKSIFELFDNLSEMTSIEGIAKGGNYQKKMQYIDNIQKIEHYKDYSNTVGFRCVAEYVK